MTDLPDIECVIAGKSLQRPPFFSPSIFYPQYIVPTPSASPLDISSAIGATRRVERETFQKRAAYLLRAAHAFQFSPEHIKHTVKVTGIPYRVVRNLLEDIPQWIKKIVLFYGQRFDILDGQPERLVLRLPGGLKQILTPLDGFCYVILPANDPRAAVLAAANLGYLGIPFVLKASRHDAISPLIIQALLDGGFDPSFASLIYFDNHATESRAYHTRLIQESSVVWTFGPRHTLDAVMPPADLLTQENRPKFLYHEHGACAAIFGGDFTSQTVEILHKSLELAGSCTATRAAFYLSKQEWLQAAVETITGMTTGDPLNPATEIGYIHPRNLDTLELLMRKHQHQIRFYGGKRLSPVQMEPLAVECLQPVQSLMGQEIPAYYFAFQQCNSLTEAVTLANDSLIAPTRLAVGLFGFNSTEANPRIIIQIKSQIIQQNQPTSTILPYYHEGNDYAMELTRSQLLT
jgi:acyl-CoA reductase-like NAD-dependent aldehyde dehydrogenase